MQPESDLAAPAEHSNNAVRLHRDVQLSTRKKLAFSLAVMAALIGAVEVSFRILGLGKQVPVARYISDWHSSPDGRTFWVVRVPGYNRDWMRDRDHPVEKPPRVHRIVCLGDSVTVGHTLKRAETYPYLLEAFLEQHGVSVEVFNVAVPGWSTRQQVAAYHHIARRYGPDEVFLGFCLNDVAEMYNNLSSSPPLFIGFFMRNSAFIRWIIDAEGRQVRSIEELFDNADAPPVREGWRLVFTELAHLQDATRRDGCELSVVIFPFRLQLGPDAPPPIAQQTLIDFCRRRGIGYLDLLPALRKIGPGAFLDESHLSVEGTRAVAREIIRWGAERRG